MSHPDGASLRALSQDSVSVYVSDVIRAPCTLHSHCPTQLSIVECQKLSVRENTEVKVTSAKQSKNVQ